MRVTVLEGLVTQQHISLRERCHDVVIGFENMLTREYRRVRVIDTIAPDGVVDLQVVAAPHVEIFEAVRRRGMDTTRACVGRHMLTQHNRYRLIGKGWAQQ